jgi:hypothetical protein
MQAMIGALQSATQALAEATPTNVSCAARAALASGSQVGHGTHPGAVMILTCNAGFALVGVSGGGNAVVCDSTGSWSDSNRARCARATTTMAPTSAPIQPPAQTVSCCATADNFVAAVYMNGVQLSVQREIPVAHNTLQHWSFPSSATTLVVHAGDFECGCRWVQWSLSLQ